jgi:DNA polymerase-3 subunit gamma/tau
VTTGSHYTVLARRFRPQAFDDVVGQEHVSRALRNAIRAGRVAHAYMFTGARGVGKTSTARILAKALNCPNVVDGVPCNQCEICDGISAGNDVDVLEIDGASNRGIDDIRSLRANVGVRSMRTQFKVYIIDEVHMLTKEAFNALLKTLEEPPPNVKFVFCTTEPNKVPDTILSRCQRFDFSSINDRSIGDRLREIAKAEGFEVAEDALELVARRARGSMRDSQSLFDQLLAFSDGTVSSDDVHRMLGTAGDERLVEFFDAIIEHRPGEVLTNLDTAFGLGVQPGELMDQCIGYVRDLMVTLSGGTEVPLCSVANRHRDILMRQGTRLGMHSVMAAFQILSDAKNQMFRSTFARTVLEMAMVQLSLLENLTAISDLLSGRLPTLPESPAPSSTSTTSNAGAVSAPAAAPVGEKKNSDPLTRSGSLIAPPDASEHDDEESGDLDAEDSDEDLHELHATPSSSESSSVVEKPAVPVAAEAVTASQIASPLTPQGNMLAGSDEAAHVLPSVVAKAESPPQPPATAASAPAAASIEKPAPPAKREPVSSLTQADCPRLFQELLKTVGLTISAGLKMASDLVLVGPNRLEIHLDSSYDFAKKVLDQPDSRGRIEAEILKLIGEPFTVNLRLLASTRPKPTAVDEKPADPPAAVGAKNNNGSRGTSQAAESSAKPAPRPVEATPQQRNLLGEVDPSRDPFVRQVMEVFGATVVKVTVAPSVKVAETETVAEH